jgi:hypothetical protein
MGQKETINRVKRQPGIGLKVFTSHTSDKGLALKICKEPKLLNSKKKILI